MSQPLKIYLGDLTYDTVALSTEVFPLGIGYVGAYCQYLFGERVEIRLFRYIADLDAALNADPPDVLGLSNYCWNQRVGAEMFRILLERRPTAVTVWGGPNFPVDAPSRQEFMRRYVELDAYVPDNGEIGFGNLVERVLHASPLEAAKVAIRETPIEGCVTRRDGDLDLWPVERVAYPRDLDAFPSPYLTGLMDGFFDGRLVPMIQTNRGCPFSCTFCVDGATDVKKVTSFSVERVKQELEYIAARVPSNTHGMEISDLNFGMYQRDLEICDVIRDIQERHNWPKHIVASTGKNKKERIIEALQRLNGTLRLTMSVQSMTPTVLSNVQRENISLDAMMALAPRIKDAGLRTYCEIILPLPGETYASHLQTVRDLVASNIDFIKGYTLMLLAGSELATPAERQKWGFLTKFRPLTMDFAELGNGRRVIEIEEVVVGTNTLTYDEYVDLRVLAFTLWVMTRGVSYDALLKFVKENKGDIVELFLLVKDGAGAPREVADILAAFRQATMGELWDTPDQIQEHYQDDEAYGRLLSSEEGVNLLNFFGGLTVEHMEEWTDHVIGTARRLSSLQGLGQSVARQFEDVANYCRGLTCNVMGHDRLEHNPEFEFRFDVARWIADDSGKTLDQFEFDLPRRVSFRLSEEQFKVLEDLLAMHGRTAAGRGQALKYVPVQMLWRQPVQPVLGTAAC